MDVEGFGDATSCCIMYSMLAKEVDAGEPPAVAGGRGV